MALTGAQQTAVDQLKKLIEETAYTDDQLWELLVANGGSLNKTATVIWTETAVSYAGLIDIREGNSTRSMSNLHQNALKMVAFFTGATADESGVGLSRRTRTRAIERP